jgi:hypothetical protein
MNDVSTTSDPEAIARQYHKTAAEYASLARAASSTLLRAYFTRIAEEYMVRADGELRIAKRRKSDARQ